MDELFESIALWQILALFAGFVALVWAIKLFTALAHLLRIEAQEPRYRIVFESSISPSLRDALAPMRAAIEALGFEAASWVEVRRMSASQHDTTLQLLLLHREGHTGCLLGFAEVPEPVHPFGLSFRSFTVDGKQLLTLNGLRHAVVGELPETTLVDPYAVELREHWHAHQQALSALQQQQPTQRLDGPGFVRLAQTLDTAYVEQLKQQGWLRPTANAERYRFGLKAALIGAAQVARRVGAQARLTQARVTAQRKAGTQLAPPPLDVDVRAFENLEEIRTRPSPRFFAGGLLLSTLVAFAIALSGLLDPTQVLLITAIIMVHELGHYLAMRLLGYQNAAIFFIPFFGAATTGTKRDVSLTQELAVLLAGPVPGIAIAVGIALAVPKPHSEALATALMMAVIINGFNLLPMLPLDGGHIVHRLLFARSRALDAVFRVLAAAGLFAIGIGLHSMVLLIVAGVMLLAMPQGLRLIALSKKLPRDAEHDGEPLDGPVRRVFSVIHSEGRGTLPFAHKVALARSLITLLGRPRKPGCLAVLAWLGVYLGCVAGTVAALVFLVMGTAGAELGDATEIAEPDAQIVHVCPSPEAHADWLNKRLAAPLLGTQPILASTLIVEAEDADSARELRAVLQRLPGATTELDSLLLHTATAASPPADHHTLDALAQAGGLLIAGHGDWELYDVSCSAPDESGARSIAKELSGYLSVPQPAYLWPPWLPRQLDDDERARQQRARETYAALDQTSQQITKSMMMQNIALGCASLCNCGGPPDEAEMQRSTQRFQQQRREAVQRLVEADPARYDAEVVQLYLATLEVDFLDHAAHAQAFRTLGERMGQLPLSDVDDTRPRPAVAQDAFAAYNGEASHEQQSVRVRMLSFGQPATGLPALVGYLCAAGCQDVRTAITASSMDDALGEGQLDDEDLGEAPDEPVAD